VTLRHGEGHPHRGRGGKAETKGAGKHNPSSRPQSPSQHFSVTYGRTPLGTIDVIDGAFVAYDASGLLIGRFSTLKKAADSLGDGGGP
jgi:hypothetical protein